MLSQGERQRVLIARALMAKPAILILDEPCEGLDPVARERFLDDLRKLAKRKNAPGLVLVTHHIEEIVPEFTHVLALRRRPRQSTRVRNLSGLNGRTLKKIFDAPLSVLEVRCPILSALDFASLTERATYFLAQRARLLPNLRARWTRPRLFLAIEAPSNHYSNRVCGH